MTDEKEEPSYDAKVLEIEYQNEFIVNETKSVKISLTLINNGKSNWPSMARICQI
jgi:hypothetical protein